jgi:hypothetical protein
MHGFLGVPENNNDMLFWLVNDLKINSITRIGGYEKPAIAFSAWVYIDEHGCAGNSL